MKLPTKILIYDNWMNLAALQIRTILDRDVDILKFLPDRTFSRDYDQIMYMAYNILIKKKKLFQDYFQAESWHSHFNSLYR
jgi:hypothetical protein